jgi:hypothetical protein
MNIDTVEMSIFHQPDDPTLGLVHYLPLFDPTVSVNDHFSNQHICVFSIYPNSATDQIMISSRELLNRIEVFDLSEEILFSIREINSGFFKISLSELMSEIYFAKCADSKGMTKTLKFLKISN